MARNLSSDARNSLTLVAVATVVAVLCLFPTHLLPREDHAVWKNIYIWSSSGASSDYNDIGLCVLLANRLNTARGRPTRLWSEAFVLSLGMACVLLTASLNVQLIPRIGIVDSLFEAVLGMACARLLIDGVPARVWRSLVARHIDYGGRFFPLLGGLLVLLTLGIWVWALAREWAAATDTPGFDLACFMLGVVCAVVGGKRVPPPPSVVEA